MSTSVKRRWQQSASSDADSSKKRRTQTRAALKNQGPYRSAFSKDKGKTIEEVYSRDPVLTEDFFIMGAVTCRNNILSRYPALKAALRALPEAIVDRHPGLERAFEHYENNCPSQYIRIQGHDK
ncbi:hypothetical protein G6011_01363 [Alternaria panax]|uniref:Uncharacterized protein n=1 Tax=Alternaria panax TaxID=48097 RepID=A0AAD4IJU7_9PLEO|nr:hypothetical protein G6011_01363 [Alternaria panax]